MGRRPALESRVGQRPAVSAAALCWERKRPASLSFHAGTRRPGLPRTGVPPAGGSALSLCAETDPAATEQREPTTKEDAVMSNRRFSQ